MLDYKPVYKKGKHRGQFNILKAISRIRDLKFQLIVFIGSFTATLLILRVLIKEF